MYKLNQDQIDMVREGFGLQHRFDLLILELASEDNAQDLLSERMMTDFSTDELYQLMYHLAWYSGGLREKVEAAGTAYMIKKEREVQA